MKNLLRYLPLPTILFLFLFSIITMGVPHFDQVSHQFQSPFADAVRENLQCPTNLDTQTEDCTQQIRQIRAITAAAAAAILTITASLIGDPRIQKSFAALAGICALKATFNQLMYTTNGDFTIPFVILGVAVFLASTITASVISRRHNGIKETH